MELCSYGKYPTNLWALNQPCATKTGWWMPHGLGGPPEPIGPGPGSLQLLSTHAQNLLPVWCYGWQGTLPARLSTFTSSLPSLKLLALAMCSIHTSRLGYLAMSPTTAGHCHHARPMAQVSWPEHLHPIWPCYHDSLYHLARSILADVLPSQSTCNMVATNALPIINCPWTTCKLFFCMYPSLVWRELGSSWPSTTPSNSTDFWVWPCSALDTLALELWPLGSSDLQLIRNWCFRWFLHATTISCISHSSLDTCRLDSFHSLALFGSLSSFWPSCISQCLLVELQGIYALLVTLKHFCIQCHITSGGLMISCDNQGVLSQAQHFHKHIPFASAYVDFLWLLEADHRSIVYVPGHQDTLSWLEDLPLLAQMNVWADSLAKKELHQIATLLGHHPVSDKPQGEWWYAKVPLGEITSDPHLVVLDHLGQWEALWYWSHKQQLNAQSFGMVHWETLEKTIWSFPPTFQMWLSKFASGHLAVASMMHYWKCWETATCPLCQSLEETMAHILLCPHPSCRETWAQQITQLQHWLTQSDMALDIQHCLLSTLTHQHHQHFQTHTSALCSLVASDQDCIGFFGFMVGRLASKWINIQGLHFWLAAHNQPPFGWPGSAARSFSWLMLCGSLRTTRST